MIVLEFYGHIRQMIKHPEASWILDDMYRCIATSQQRARILRECYGQEFSLFRAEDEAIISPSLSDILAENPEKRGPVMRSLLYLINHSIRDKTTCFNL